MFYSTKVKIGKYEVSLRTNDRDSAITLVLIHGIGVSEKYFRPLAYELANKFKVVSINMPGYGESPKPKRALSISELSEVIKNVLDQENILQPVLIGHSMGCQVVTQVAAKYPRTLQKMILIAPTINSRERTKRWQLWRLVQDMLHEPLKVNAIILRDYLMFGPLRYWQTQKYMLADKIENTLPGCPHPTLFLRGTKDKIVPHEWAASLAEISEKFTLVEIDDGQHNMQFTQPKKIAQQCIDFINL